MTAQEISDLELAVLTSLLVHGSYEDEEFKLVRLPRPGTHRIRLTRKADETVPLAEADIGSVRGMLSTYLFHFRKVRVDEPSPTPTHSNPRMAWTMSPLSNPRMTPGPWVERDGRHTRYWPIDPPRMAADIGPPHEGSGFTRGLWVWDPNGDLIAGGPLTDGGAFPGSGESDDEAKVRADKALDRFDRLVQQPAVDAIAALRAWAFKNQTWDGQPAHLSEIAVFARAVLERLDELTQQNTTMDLLLAVHGTCWPGDFDPKADPTTPPKWWVVTREHYATELRHLERVCDELTSLLDVPDPKLSQILDVYNVAWKHLGQVHATLGKLPIGVLKMPDPLFRKWNTTMARADRLLSPALDTPIPMLLHCPACHAKHVDAPDPAVGWDNPPHRSHLCTCGCVWRPADVPTIGVLGLETRGDRDNWEIG